MAVTTGPPELISYRGLIWNFAQRDLKSRFKGTALGWLWSLVVPIATLATYTVVFAVIFRIVPPPMGNGREGIFTLWLFCGLVVWSMFANSVSTAMGTLIATGPLLKKIYFPAYAPVLGTVIAVLIQSVIELGVLLVVLVLLMNFSWTWLLLPLWFLLLTPFVAGMAIVLSVLNVYFRDLSHLVSVALQLLFYATPIIFPVTQIPASWQGVPLQALMSANPMTQFVEVFRSLVYHLETDSLRAWLYLFGWSVGSVILAMWVFQRRGHDLSEEL